MSELLKQKLKENGADVEGTLHRFMNNDALFLKFILKFKDDQNYAILKKHLDEKNYEEAFKRAEYGRSVPGGAYAQGCEREFRTESYF